MDASPEYKSPSDYGQETWKECYRVIKTPVRNLAFFFLDHRSEKEALSYSRFSSYTLLSQIPTLTRTFSSGTTHRINMTVWDNEYMVAVGSKGTLAFLLLLLVSSLLTPLASLYRHRLVAQRLHTRGYKDGQTHQQHPMLRGLRRAALDCRRRSRDLRVDKRR